MDLAEQHGVAEFLADRDSRFPRRQSFSLPWAVDGATPQPDTVVEFTPILPSALRDEGEKVALTVAGRRYMFAKAAKPLLEALVDARVLTVAELAERAGVEVDTAAALTRVLVQNHLVLLRSTY